MNMAADFRRAMLPASVMRDAGLEPDEWQEDVLSSVSTRILMMCSRQVGKTTTTSFLAINQALEPDSLVLMIAPSQRQSGELFRAMKNYLFKLPYAPKVEQESALRLELSNGSRIVALPGTEATIRGFSGPQLIVVDEAARIEDGLLAGIRPMLATTNGRLVMLSTPYGRRGAFYEAWIGNEQWERIRITADECPRITEEFLQSEREALGEWQFKQEYMCEFVDTDEAFFNSDIIEQAIFHDLEPLWA
ncbi:terminase family protein [Microbulbifer sp.]|uniref:terminase large subunit domain-containing protein n=1 Tax=Microbulbifer sp. TaxID=1908541 RepID=UPI00258F5953|nr:terminase family protein [Microbulbifer sp.]